MNHGELTANVAGRLAEKFEGRVEILFDHGDPALDQVGVIHSWFGDKLSRKSLLADLDIAVVLPKSNDVILLAEIEESSSSPKTLLGDIFATLLAGHFTFQSKRQLNITECAEFLVLFHGSPRDDLVHYIDRRLHNLGDLPFEVVMSSFGDKTDLESQLSRHIDSAITNYWQKSAIANRKSKI